MENYTEELKNYWKSEDLWFYARFKRIKENYGFFYDFRNPKNLEKLYYPQLNGVEILDSRVSFAYRNVKGFANGQYYKVSLEYTENPQGKNNYYSLGIGSIEDVNQANIENGLKQKDQKTVYCGRYQKKSDNFAFFENVITCETDKILVSNREPKNVYVFPKHYLKEGEYYTFLINMNNGRNLPNAVEKSIKKAKVNPYKEYIRLRFERLNNPEANKMIANLMREIGKGMYSSKQRMIFELLQNADDAPGKEKLEFNIDINGDYFFIMHDGTPFSKDDIEAITSAAESTKRSDSKKTGYKGIGFKSVFTDSSEVWLKSGGYQFAFLRNSQLFEDFDKFYFSSERYLKYPELLHEDKLKYRNQKLRFNGSTDIPWQVIPIWQDKLPKEFNSSDFDNHRNLVQFALKIGRSNIEGYEEAIKSIAKRPQFLLFLRNTKKFKASKGDILIEREDRSNTISISKKENRNSHKYKYIKQTFSDVEVSDEAFAELGIGLKKASKINDYNEVTYYFTDVEGNQIETIPPKLASATATEISFGISLRRGIIAQDEAYIRSTPQYSSLFTFLPMEDTRFQFPFLVNADFVPSSDRQKLQGDNLWNIYIMTKVAEKHVKILENYALEFIGNNKTYENYLSLLLKETIPIDDTAAQIISSYNKTYKKELKTTPIVVNDNNEVQLIDNTILDTSGFTELFGNSAFYEIIHTLKRLPHSKLGWRFLKSYKYLKIENINIERFSNELSPSNCKRLGELIVEKSLYDKPELLEWLDKLLDINPNYFKYIPFIFHNGMIYSISDLLDADDVWLLSSLTVEYEAIFNGLGYKTIDISKYRNINYYLLRLGGYVNDKMLTYSRISDNPNLSKLDISLKLKLIEFFRDSDFMVRIGVSRYFEELKLFVDENRIPRPIRQLINRDEDIDISSLYKYRIAEDEYNALPETLKRELVNKEQIFTSFILNIDLFSEWTNQFNSENIDFYVRDLMRIYSWVKYKDSIASAQWASIPWLFVNNEIRFLNAEKVYWSNAFFELPKEDYKVIKEIIEQSELKLLPPKACADIIKTFGLKTDNKIDDFGSRIRSITTSSVNILLDWIEGDGGYSDFFENYVFTSSGEDSWSVVRTDRKVYDGSDRELSAYIESKESLRRVFIALDEDLCSNTRSRIGLLQGDKLLDSIVKSKAYDQGLAILLPSNLSFKQLDSFVNNLSEFKLQTNHSYDSSSPEHIIIYNLCRLIESVQSVSRDLEKCIQTLRKKILVNDTPLSNYDLSNRIQFGRGVDKKTLNLSDVLDEYKGESNVLDELIESFGAIKEKIKLHKVIFKTRQMDLEDVCIKIEQESSSYYSVYQVVFYLLYKEYYGEKKMFKINFDNYWSQQHDEVKLKEAYKLFFDVLKELNFTNLLDFSFHGFELKKFVDKNYAIRSEIIPDWMEEWVAVDTISRIKFISRLGYNDSKSSIVKLRDELKSNNFNYNSAIRYFEESKFNKQIIWNTIVWLSAFNTDKISRGIAIVKAINNCIDFESPQSLVVPTIRNISKNGERIYNLVNINVNTTLYKLNKNEKYTYDIYNAFSRNDESIIIVDDSIGALEKYFNIKDIELKDSIDVEILERDSKLWDEPYYTKWEFYNDYPIYIYKKQEIPYVRTFEGISVNKYTSALKIEYNGRYYVSSILRTDILNSLPESFPDSKLKNLKAWHYRTLQDESLLDEDAYQYSEDIDRLLQNKLGISEEQQKKESGNAKTHAVYFLDKEGFNISDIENRESYFANIISPEGKTINCIVRSAKGGLLYIDKDHWDMFKDNSMYLIVIYPGNNPRLFKNREELLQEELAENIMFRIPNSRDVSDVDDMFNVLNSETRLILVTSEKMRQSLFSGLKQKNEFIRESGVAIGGDDFKF